MRQMQEAAFLTCWYNVFDVKSLPGACAQGRLCCICNRTQYIKREQDFSF